MKAAPIFFEIMDYVNKSIVQSTRHLWKYSSYIYSSYSHSTGYAWDLVPDISRTSRHLYAHNYQSDPVLFNRAFLVRALQGVARDPFLKRLLLRASPLVTLVIAIEQNHLHIGLYRNETYKEFTYPNNVRVWKYDETVKYNDHTLRRRMHWS